MSNDLLEAYYKHANSVSDKYPYTRVIHYKQYLDKFPKDINLYVKDIAWQRVGREIKKLDRVEITEEIIKSIMAKQRLNQYIDNIPKIMARIQNPDFVKLVSLPISNDNTNINKTVGDIIMEHYIKIEATYRKIFPDKYCFFNPDYITEKIIDVMLQNSSYSKEIVDTLTNLKTMVENKYKESSIKKNLLDKQFEQILSFINV